MPTCRICETDQLFHLNATANVPQVGLSDLATGDRWFVDETYVKVAGRWRYLYRAVDQYGQVIDMLLSEAAGHHRRPPLLHQRTGPWPDPG